jgi:hypothetical protein
MTDDDQRPTPPTPATWSEPADTKRPQKRQPTGLTDRCDLNHAIAELVAARDGLDAADAILNRIERREARENALARLDLGLRFASGVRDAVRGRRS